MSRLCPHDRRFLSDKSHLSVSLIVHLCQIPQYQWDFCGTCMSAWLGSIIYLYGIPQAPGEGDISVWYAVCVCVCQICVRFMSLLSLLWSSIPLVSHLYVRCVCVNCVNVLHLLLGFAWYEPARRGGAGWTLVQHHVWDLKCCFFLFLLFLLFVSSWCSFFHDLAIYVIYYFGLRSHHLGCQGPRQTLAPATTKASTSSCGQNMTSCDNWETRHE